MELFKRDCGFLRYHQPHIFLLACVCLYVCVDVVIAARVSHDIVDLRVMTSTHHFSCMFMIAAFPDVCSRYLQRMCRSDAGSSTIMACGGVGVVSSLLKDVATDSKAAQVRVCIVDITAVKRYDCEAVALSGLLAWVSCLAYVFLVVFLSQHCRNALGSSVRNLKAPLFVADWCQSAEQGGTLQCGRFDSASGSQQHQASCSNSRCAWASASSHRSVGHGSASQRSVVVVACAGRGER